MVVRLLSKVTEYVQEPFISEELGENFAIAINYCLAELATSRGMKLKIKNPERFYFQPKELLIDIVTMYGNMMD